MKQLISIAAVFLIGMCLGISQTILNPSFEGPRGPSVSPPGWISCGQGSSPDTQPGCWQVRHAANDGHSYLSLICRGGNVPFPNQVERCGQELDAPLKQGRCYLMQVSLARSHRFYAGSVYFNQPAIFRIWGGSELCDMAEVLWQSPLIEHTEWANYEFIILPKKNCHSLVLETYFADHTTYSGNILIDNLLIVPEVNPCVPMALQE